MSNVNILERKTIAIFHSLDLYNYLLNRKMQKQWELTNIKKGHLEKILALNAEKIRNGNIETLEVGQFKKNNKPKKKLIKL